MANVTIIPPQVANISGIGQGGSETAPLIPGSQSSVVSGTIIGKDDNGNFLLRTQQGNLTLQSNTPLTYNSDVVLRLNSGGGQGQSANIVSVNGEPFAEFSAQVPSASDSVSQSLIDQSSQNTQPQTTPAQSTPVTQNTSAAVSPPEALANGFTSANIIRAVVVTSPATPAAETDSPVDNTQVNLQQGAQVVVRLSDLSQSAPVETAVVQNVPVPNTAAQVNQQQQQTTTQPVTTPAAAQSENEIAVAQTVTPSENTAQTNISDNPQPQPQQSSATSNAANQNLPNQTATTSQPTAQTAVPSNALYAAYTKPVLPQAPQSPQAAAPQNAAVAAQSTATSPRQSPSTPVPTIVDGKILTADTQGNVSVQIPSGVVTLKANVLPSSIPLTPGSAVTIEIPAAANQATISSALQNISLTPATFTELATGWTTLKDILTLLNQTGATSTPSGANVTNNSAASNLLARLPNLDSNF